MTERDLISRAVTAEQQLLLRRMLDHTFTPKLRARAGRKLAALGDPRPGVAGLDGAWCPVPGGACMVGGDSEAYNAAPAQIVVLPPFWIARYPVTNAQFAAFIADRGYDEEHRDCWTEAGWVWKEGRAAPNFWDDPAWNLSNHPVVGVSWFEAYAYAQWLEQQRRAGQMLLPPEIPETYVLRLPTEAEWECAARHPDGRSFPWGDAYERGIANVDETANEIGPSNLRYTTAVGIYGQDRDGTRAEDLSGNVWEWCLSAWAADYRHPAPNEVESKAARVWRGGSWGLSVDQARAATRQGANPDIRSGNNLGFRLVASVPIPSH